VRWRVIGVLLASPLFLTSLSGTAHASDGCVRLCTSNGQVSSDDGSLLTHVGEHGPGSSGTGTPPSHSDSGSTPTGPVIQYAYRPVCGDGCDAALAKTTLDSFNCAPPAEVVWVLTTVVGSGIPLTINGPPECLTLADQLGYDPPQLAAMVANYFERIPLPEPGLHIAPADNAVVNLPEIVSADRPPVTTFTVDQAPFPVVTITAAVQWDWDFGDGTTLVTSNPGRAYDGTDPADGGYVTHTYKTANAAWPLSVTSVWTATYTVQGVAGVETVTNAVRRTTAHPLASAEYGSVLTGN
jgi:hypothetical protein